MHLRYLEQDNAGRRTKKFLVQSTNTVDLGRIEWFTHWRRYVFYPFQSTLYDAECLEEIAKKCKRLTEEHKE